MTNGRSAGAERDRLAIQCSTCVGDWAARRPGLRPGGWAFQYENPHYPDLDDTAVVGMALDRFDAERYRHALDRAAEWIVGMQSRNGGWAAFDADNTHYLLNHIPFADHGALLDPPTADVSARCLGFLAQLGYGGPTLSSPRRSPICGANRRATGAGSAGGEPITFMEPGPSWRPSTRSASTLAASEDSPRWVVSRQHSDGGWGEGAETYWPEVSHGYEASYSTASQTAWALLGLMAAGEVENPAVARGISYLIARQDRDGEWDEPWYTAVGFPRVFYLRYHGYRFFFPLWALARYRNLQPHQQRARSRSGCEVTRVSLQLA